MGKVDKNKENVISKSIKIILINILIIVAIFTIGRIPMKYFVKTLILDYTSKDEYFKKTIDNLDTISYNLKGLDVYINLQKQKLIEEQEILQNLKEEKEILELLAESDRKVVEAFFIEQEKRQIKNIWKERSIGCIIGVISSLIASYIYKKISAKKGQRGERRAHQ